MRLPAFFLSAILILSVFAVLSCNEKNNKLEKALLRAGNNRGELEKVLAHYSNKPDQSLQYNAAVFLIENMPDKFSYKGTQYSQFLHFIDSACSRPITVDDYKAALDSFKRENKSLVGNLDKVFDIDIVKADFLIQNIDEACYAYKNSPWYKEVSFESFCNYILPYRIGNEPLENFKSVFYDKYKSLLNDSLSLQRTADTILKRISQKEIEILSFPDFVPDLPISTLLKIRGGTCRESSNLGIYILRSLGLPVADDFTPQWPNRGMGHSWSALLINKDSCIDFEGATSSKVGDHLRLSSTHRMAKAYRHVFGSQEKSLALLHGEEPIPDFFNTPYIVDVSSHYFKTTSVSFNVPKNIQNKYLYLCVFDNQNWVPIDWAQKISHKVSFPFVGKSAVYIAATFQDGTINPFSFPLLVDSNGKQTELIPHLEMTQTITLRRKYPVFDWWNTRTSLLKGASFQAANSSDFSNPIDAYKISEIPEMTYQDINLDLKTKFQYWRFLAKDSSGGDMAEIEFYDQDGKILQGKLIGTPVAGKNKIENAFDNKPLTYFQGDSVHGNWVGLKFDKPYEVKKIRYLCRNDGNFIENGDIYELYYWQSGNWKSLERITGDSTQSLRFTNAPTNALFLLHDVTKGKEERIFTYSQDGLRWW